MSGRNPPAILTFDALNSDGPAMTSVENRLLQALPHHVLADMTRGLEPVALSAGQVLQQPLSALNHAYFPTDSVLSVVASSGVGEGEIGMIGREGTTALPLVFEADRSPHKIVVQISGGSLRIGADRLRLLMEAHPELGTVLLRYAQCWSIQVSQTSLANARNTVRERLSRWLIMCQDRTESSEVSITHEALATVLGVRRPGITVATHELEGDGAIRAKRGCIRILDREKLDAGARSSYGVAEREYERLLGERPYQRHPVRDGAGHGHAYVHQSAA